MTLSYVFEAEKNQIIEAVLSSIQLADSSESELCQKFAGEYLGTVALEDLTARSVDNWRGLVIHYWDFIRDRKPNETKIRIYNPESARDGWQSTHTVIEVVHDDIPFVVDSLHMEIQRLGYVSHLIIHSGGLKIKRDKNNKVTAILSANAEDGHGFSAEADLLIEINHQTDPAVFDRIRTRFERVLKDVRSMNRDWSPMRKKVKEMLEEMDTFAPFVDADELAESKGFLRWLEEHHFTFLGIRDYEWVKESKKMVGRAVPGTALGILSEQDEEESADFLASMTPEAQKLLLSSDLLLISKTNTLSTVHRPIYMDYIGVKRFNKEGQVIGERRLIGLYTAAAYNASARQIPFLRRKIALIMAQSHLNPKAHTGKILLNIVETLPRDDLFQALPSELLNVAMGIYHMQERRQMRLFALKDVYGRFISCLLYMPRDRYNTTLGKKMIEVIQRSFQAKEVSYTTRFSDSVLAQIHFMVRLAEPDLSETLMPSHLATLEKELIEISRLWTDDLKNLLITSYGEIQGAEFYHRYSHAFSAGYQDSFLPAIAAYDIGHIEQLSTNRQIQMHVYRPINDTNSNLIRFKLYRFETTIPLSDVLPILERLGLRVISERPFEIKPADGKKVWINDFGLVAPQDICWEREDVQAVFKEAFENIWFKRAENDGFNQLVLSAQLTWREVSILRAYAKYFKQIHLPYSQEYIEIALATHADITKQLVELFLIRFGVDEKRTLSQREAESQAILASIRLALDNVTSLDHDKILRRYMDVILATARTNYFQLKKDGKHKSYLSFKLQPSKIPDMPLPLPLYEIFIYAPRFEGIHLRCAKVARGGIRWSDRREDFRTEVLGLMKAQQVKNAVIVPSGAKGGFCPKNLPLSGGREAIFAEGVACYKRFIRALLDITDNYEGNVVIRPQRVYCYDDEDPYLVVAADKGTASFSDIANKISIDHHFWLGDAFASGGSAGYDHKKMGITARGAWESVKRHFHERGVDTQTMDFTMVGIGDMSGDVFGNGALLSPHIQLVAAFNHAHIFVDPNPDAMTSFKERTRLFHLPTSTWADYNLDCISKGGGVFNRSAKFIVLSDEIKTRFELTQDTIEPNEFIRVLLRSSVDLLWNGGIGTYVKSIQETHMDVGDRANDALRINGNELRCRVVGEGGNLGFTQLGRIEYALQGGLIYTDFIDNSAGVDCSDNEVNIKILLNPLMALGELTEKQRNELLVSMTDEVAQLVLNDNYQQIQAISLAACQGFRSIGLHSRYLRSLEEKGLLNRELEFLPDEKTLQERQLHEQGLTRSEMAVLFAYTKNILRTRILESNVPDDPYLNRVLVEAFPKQLQETYILAMEKHRLKREIISTKLSNMIVNTMGFTFIYRTEDETGASIGAIVKAFIIACHIFDMNTLVQGIQALDGKIATADQIEMMMVCVRWMRRMTRWLLRSRREHANIAAALDFYSPGVTALKQIIPECLNDSERERYESACLKYRQIAVPEALSHELAMIPTLFSALDIVEASYELKGNMIDAARVYFRVGTYLELVWLRDQVIKHMAENHWESLSREVLRDDLDKQQCLLTIGILSHKPEAMDLHECLALWTERYAEFVQRWRTNMIELKNTSVLSFTMFFMIVRVLVDLTQTALKLQLDQHRSEKK